MPKLLGSFVEVKVINAIEQEFGSERLTSAVLDRLTHRCHILESTGESYRLQDARRRRTRSRLKPATSSSSPADESAES